MGVNLSLPQNHVLADADPLYHTQLHHQVEQAHNQNGGEGYECSQGGKHQNGALPSLSGFILWILKTEMHCGYHFKFRIIWKN